MLLCTDQVDLAHIKDAFKREFDKDLAEAIQRKTSGEYRRLLVAIVRY